MGALDGVQLRRVTTIQDVMDCQSWAYQRRPGPLGYDTESAGLEPHRDRLRLIQLGDTRCGWAFPPQWYGPAVEILASYPGPLVAHNSPYDNRVLSIHTGWQPPWEKIDDTVLIGHLAHSIRTAKLKPRAAIEIDPRAMAGEAELEAAKAARRWTWATVPDDFPPYYLYGALDPVLTAHLHAKLAPEVYGQFAASYDLERATARICADMMMAGMMIDVPFIEAKIAKIRSYIGEASRWLSDTHNIGSVNSNEQVGMALNLAGVPTLAWTDGGKPKIDKATLKLYRTSYPHAAQLIDAITWCRKGEAIIGRYLEKFLGMRVDGDIVHYTIWSSRARTGRMSVTDPPMQTFDRDEPIIRGAFIPRPGYVFITIDADQIEARMTAHFSGDRQMIEDFRAADAAGIGFFIIMASRIYGGKISKKDPRYTWTKNATYGQIYGAGVDKVAVTAGVPLEAMREPYTAFKMMYPQVGVLMNRLIRAGRSSPGLPEVRTIMNRRLYADRGHEYALLNYKVQGSAAEVMKTGQVALVAAGFGPYLRLDIHDEILMEVPRELAPDMLRAATEILTDRVNFAVPITWAGSILEERWAKT